MIDAIAEGAVDVVLAEPLDETTTADCADLAELKAIAAVLDFHRRHSAELLVPKPPPSAPDAAPIDPRVKPDLTKGEPWGPLIILEYIGGGTFGDVYRAWDPALEKVVALKRTRYGSAADAERAAREAKRLANIPAHPNVVTVYGACNVEGVVGIWMEYLRGRSLQHLVADEGELGWVEAAHYGECVCRALSHIHSHQLLHRDVKAANVMKAAGGRIVLIDFGSGSDLAAIGARDPERLVGTLPYIAPELFDRRPATPQSDIYSLGVLLFNLVTGSYPVVARSRVEFEAAHRAGRRTLLTDLRSDLPTPFVRVVERAIAADVAHRYKTAGELLNDLSAPTMPGVPEPAVPSRPATLVKRVLWWITGAVCALASLGVVSSRSFNMAMGRSAFADETIADYFYWGVKSSVAPALVSIVALLGVALVSEGCQLACGWSERARAWQRSLRDKIHALGLDDVSNLASCALFVSAAALVAAWWYVVAANPILAKWIALASPDVSTVGNQTLAFLSPAFEADRQLYRQVFTAALVMGLVAWYPTIRVAVRKRELPDWRALVGGAAVFLLVLMFLDFPYRLIAWDPRKAQEVKWHGAECYILGERQIDVLLFCPQLPPPRNNIVRKNDPTLEETPYVKDMFEHVPVR